MWNDHQSNIITSISELFQGKDFIDVTLVYKKDSQIEAYRVNLTIASDFFNRILRENKHTHPMIMN